MLKDLDKADIEGLKKVNGVLGVKLVGQQVQWIVGQKAGALCAEFCAFAGITQDAAADTDAQAAPAKKSVAEQIKDIPNKILDVMSNCIQPLLPIIICASMFKLMCTLIGPSLFGLFPEDSDLYQLFNFVGDVPFYFLPVLVGYTSAKYFGISIPLGIVMGGVLLHPTLTGIVEAGEPFTVYGIPMPLVGYSSSIVPVLLCVFVMSYVDRFFQKVLPDMLKFMLAHFLTLAVMLPIGLCVLAPAGNIVATSIAGVFVKIPEYLGPVGVGLVCLVWPLLVSVGMHMPVAMLALTTFLTVGHEDICFIADTGFDLTPNDLLIASTMRQELAYRQPLAVTQIRCFRFASGLTGFPVCPRCRCTMEREYQSHCDRCGQTLDWRNFDRAVTITLET